MKFKAALAALTFSAMTTASAQASSVQPEIGFNLSISSSTGFDNPTFFVANSSSADVTLDQFTFTIGDVSRNFDVVSGLSDPPGGTATLKSPDTLNGNVRSDVLAFDFTGLDPSEGVPFSVTIDQDGVIAVGETFTTVFFNNGAALNSVATAFFSNGRSLSLRLPDNPSFDQFGSTQIYSFFVSAVVPLPAALPLFVAGLAGLGFVARRRKTAA